MKVEGVWHFIKCNDYIHRNCSAISMKRNKFISKFRNVRHRVQWVSSTNTHTENTLPTKTHFN